MPSALSQVIFYSPFLLSLLLHRFTSWKQKDVFSSSPASNSLCHALGCHQFSTSLMSSSSSSFYFSPTSTQAAWVLKGRFCFRKKFTRSHPIWRQHVLVQKHQKWLKWAFIAPTLSTPLRCILANKFFRKLELWNFDILNALFQLNGWPCESICCQFVAEGAGEEHPN